MSAISLQNVSKRYVIHPSGKSLMKNLFIPGETADGTAEHRALRDINLEIAAGQCVGFIGRNGSGKSTLLKVIAGIVHPTSGKVSVHGRLSTVLDVHSGLHSRLTGRQNIFLKGALHGMKKDRIEQKIASIIEFSGLSEYIEAPIHTYSSGMIIRLGFSIAMHMDFDILLMDEVLSVGDIVFQRQCLARAREFIRQGKTIILATHSLGDTAAICQRVILLNHGSIQHDGETENVLQSYWDACEREQNKIPRHLHPFNPDNIYGSDSGEIRIRSVKFASRNGREQKTFWTGDPMLVVIRFECRKPVKNPLFRVQFYRNEGLWVHGANTARVGFKTGVLQGKGEVILEYERLNLLEGDYYVSVGIWPDEYRSLMTDIAYDCHQWAYAIRVKSNRQDGGGIVSNPFTWRLNNCATDIHPKVEQLGC